jgi:hypothetical protein
VGQGKTNTEMSAEVVAGLGDVEAGRVAMSGCGGCGCGTGGDLREFAFEVRAMLKMLISMVERHPDLKTQDKLEMVRAMKVPVGWVEKKYRTGAGAGKSVGRGMGAKIAHD